MLHLRRICLITALALILWVLPAGADDMILINEALEPATREETDAMLASAAEAYFTDASLYAELSGEISRSEIPDPFAEEEDSTLTIYSLTHGGQTMRFMMERLGEPGENGRYPLYITLHGGGESTPESNDVQWMVMHDYYRGAVDNGLYIACRGITDTWDLHFRPGSYPLYDRLIQAAVYLYHADPDRVYLLGFSAGGDGVYQIAPRMADRFAAANMSSGHPNGVSLLNLMNCPFGIQVGVRDYYSESAMRCIRGAEMDRVLNGYREKTGQGYVHRVLVHVPAGHNFDDCGEADAQVLADPAAYADPGITLDMMDAFLAALTSTTGEWGVDSLSYYPESETPAFDEAVRGIVTEEFGLKTVEVDANAVRWVSGFVRDPAPKTVVWDLSTRAATREAESFYWFKADKTVDQGTVTASLTGDNTLTVTPENVNGDFSILVSPALLDLSRPIKIITPDGERLVRVNPSYDTMLSSMRETGDPALAWAAEIPWSLLR